MLASAPPHTVSCVHQVLSARGQLSKLTPLEESEYSQIFPHDTACPSLAAHRSFETHRVVRKAELPSVMSFVATWDSVVVLQPPGTALSSPRILVYTTTDGATITARSPRRSAPCFLWKNPCIHAIRTGLHRDPRARSREHDGARTSSRNRSRACEAKPVARTVARARNSIKGGGCGCEDLGEIGHFARQR